MKEIEKYQAQDGASEFTFPVDSTQQTEPSLNIIHSLLKRWYIVLATFIIICAIGIPVIWLIIKAKFASIAAIRVAPVLESILFSDKNSEAALPMYKNFLNTQADLITSDQVLQRVADELAGRNLYFFNEPFDAMEIIQRKVDGQQNINQIDRIKKAITNGDLSVAPTKDTELIKIIMKNHKPQDMVQIVDSILRAYMAIIVSEETKGGDQKLSVLENEQKILEDKLEKYRISIRQMAEEYGSMVLTSRQDIMLQKVAALQAELTKIQTQKITLEAKLQMFENSKEPNTDSEKMLKLPNDFLNADQTLESLTQSANAMNQQIVLIKQTLVPTNPELKQKLEVLETLKRQIHEAQLDSIKSELSQITECEKSLQDINSKQNTETIEIGRKQLAIQDQQEQLKITQELYDTIRRRIQELEMERKRPARISVAYNAISTTIEDKRPKFSIAVAFGSLACGMFLAFIMTISDKSLNTPNDLVKRIGVKIIGTTINPEVIEKLKRSEQISSDYQTILANLNLLNGAIPKRIVITSASLNEGKTTLSINLATSLAKKGKKVLLIDGDLRKPDVACVLNLPKDAGCLQNYICRQNFESLIYSVAQRGFDVLPASSENSSEALEVIAKLQHLDFLQTLSEKYDHIIIDTPPVLAFSDAQVWAKMSDGVIMVSFAGLTQQSDLKDAFERLEQIKVKIIGTILNNVGLNYSYHRYGYSSYYKKGEYLKKKQSMLLLPHEKK